MTREIFLKELARQIRKLPRADRKKYLDFYSEVLADRIEEGMTEEEAVGALGSPEEVAALIFYELGQDPEAVKTTGRKLRAWEIVLLCLGFPLWFSLGAAVFAILLAVYLVIWAADIVLWAADLSLVACGLAGVAAGIVFACQGYTPQGICVFGCGFICVGISVFWFFVCHYATKGIVRLTKILSKCILRIFKRKEH